MKSFGRATLWQALIVTAFGITLYGSPVAQAQSYPAKPVRLIVAYPPGGNVDVVARLIAPGFAEGLGQPVVVDYRGGANGMIGTGEVARAAPDGYTITLGNTSTHVTSKLLSKQAPFDAQKDFTPITMVVEPATFLVVHPSVPVSNMKELDRKSTRLNSSHSQQSRMPSSA